NYLDFFFSSKRRHTRFSRDWSSDVCSSDLKGFGIIVRTVAQGRKVAELDKDMQNLLNKWTAMCKKIKQAHHPSKVLDELTRASSIVRDVFNDSFTGIYLDDEALYYQIKDYVQEIAPKKESIVKLYESSLPIFEKFGVERQIKT